MTRKILNIVAEVEELNLDTILERQLRALDQVTIQLLEASKGIMTKDEITSLATCVKLTMELKARENELLDGLSVEQLKELAKR